MFFRAILSICLIFTITANVGGGPSGGSLANVLGTEATLPLGQAYHAGQVNPFVHKVLHGGIGAGTAAISGGNVWAGAAGAVAGELAGEAYLGTQTPTLQNTNHLTRQAANIGRVAGGLAGLAAGGDPNTGANTGTIASENNAVQAIIPYIIGAAAGSMAASTLYEAEGNPDIALQKLGSGDHPLARAMAEGTTEIVTLSADKFPEATKLALQTLSLPGVATNAVVTFADDKTGNITSKTWGSLSLETQNRLKGAGIIALSIPAAAVAHLANAAKVGNVVTKVDGPKLLPKPEERKLLVGPAAEEIRYGPMNPGPLPQGIANTFRGGSYSEISLSEPITLYRVSGGTAGKIGQYWTEIPPKGPFQAKIDLALKSEWGNTATEVTKIRVPAGQTIYRGIAESQGGAWQGGGIQVVIPEVNSNWVIRD